MLAVLVQTGPTFKQNCKTRRFPCGGLITVDSTYFAYTLRNGQIELARVDWSNTKTYSRE